MLSARHSRWCAVGPRSAAIGQASRGGATSPLHGRSVHGIVWSLSCVATIFRRAGFRLEDLSEALVHINILSMKQRSSDRATLDMLSSIASNRIRSAPPKKRLSQSP